MHIRPIPRVSDVVSLATSETEFYENLSSNMDARAMNAHAARFAGFALSDWCHEHNMPRPDTLPMPEWATALVWEATKRLTEIGWAELDRRERAEAEQHPHCAWYVDADGQRVPSVPYWRADQ